MPFARFAAPSPAGRASSPTYRLPSWLLALLAGVLLTLSFPAHPQHPLALLFHPAWAWVALLPLLIVLPGAGFRRGFRLGWVAGFAFNLLSLYWVAYTQGGGPAVVAGLFLMAAYLGLFTGLFAGSQNLLLQRWGTASLLFAPLLWAAQEYLLSLGELGFPWLLLGHSQAPFTHFIQHASATGAYGVSAWVVLLNALFFFLLRPGSTRLLRLLSAGGLTLAFLLPYLHARATVPAIDALNRDVRVALIQPNLTLEQKWGADGLERSFAVLAELSVQGAAADPDLLVWPETALPCYLRIRPQCRQRAASLIDSLGIPLLTGASDFDFERREPYNAAFFLRPHREEMQRYAKMHLVPFGERTPFRDRIPLLRDIDWTALTGALGPAEFAPGSERTLFAHPRGLFAALICFEAVFPDLVRRSVQQGALLLVNITNDSWFGDTAGPYQHAGLTVLRAVENRTSIARCAATGISLFVDPYGRTFGATKLFAPAVASGALPLRASTTFYTRHGDLFARGALALSLLVSIAAAVSRFTNGRKPSMADEHPVEGPDDPAESSAMAEGLRTDPPEGPPESPETEESAYIAEKSPPPVRTEMPFLDHLEELRWRIFKSLGAVLVGASICFIFSDPLMKILTYPYEEAVFSLEEDRSSGVVAAMEKLLRQWQGELAPAADTTAAERPSLPMGRRLQSLKPMTYFFVSLQIAFLGGLVLALPLVFYQVWQFVAPGLLSREKRLLAPIILFSVLCFAVGALIAYWIVLPLGLRFFLALEPPDMTSQWAVDEYISFVLRLILGFGLVFEMPVLAFFLARIGLLTPAYMRHIRRYAIVAIFVLSAIFTPPDPVSQILMALPLLLLYEVSIWVCRVANPRADRDPAG